MIGRCLQAIAELDLSGISLDVVLVDCASEDGTIRIAKLFMGRLDLKIVERANLHISALRNLGALMAKGQILAFLDADCLPNRDWLNRASKVLSEHGDIVVGCEYLIPPASSWVARSWYGSIPLPDWAPVSYVPAGGLFVNRTVFERLGGFNERIQTNEDCEFCLRARMAGIEVYAAKALAVVHLGTPQTLAAFFAKQHWHGTHVFRVFRQNVRTLQNARPLAFAGLVLISIIGEGLGTALALAHHDFRLLLLFSSLLVLAPMGPALRMAISRKRIAAIFPMTLLFFAYGTARALSLVNPRNW